MLRNKKYIISFGKSNLEITSDYDFQKMITLEGNQTLKINEPDMVDSILEYIAENPQKYRLQSTSITDAKYSKVIGRIKTNNIIKEASQLQTLQTFKLPSLQILKSKLKLKRIRTKNKIIDGSKVRNFIKNIIDNPNYPNAIWINRDKREFKVLNYIQFDKEIASFAKLNIDEWNNRKYNYFKWGPRINNTDEIYCKYGTLRFK